MQLEPEHPNPPRRGVKKGLYLDTVVVYGGEYRYGLFFRDGVAPRFSIAGRSQSRHCWATVHFDKAAVAIGFAVLFDMLDGRIARMTKTTTEIGIQLDSIADVVTFGLAPAVLAYVWGYGASLVEGTDLHRFALVYFVHVFDVRRFPFGALQCAGFAPRDYSPKALSKSTRRALLVCRYPLPAA